MSHPVQVSETETVDCVETHVHHHYVDTTGVHWVHPGKVEKCSAPECEQETCGYDPMPHHCEHWIDDAEYHEARGEQPCGGYVNQGSWLP